MSRGLTPEQWAGELESDLLHCRELGHAWTAYTAKYDAKSKCYDRVIRCATCGTERRQVLDSRGEVLRNSYSYVEGYLAKGQMGTAGNRVPRSVFRRAALKRMLGQ